MQGDFTNTTLHLDGYYKMLYTEADGREITVRATGANDSTDVRAVMISEKGTESVYVHGHRRDLTEYLGQDLSKFMPEAFV